MIQGDAAKRVMANGLWLVGPPGHCNQCEAGLEVGLRFRWCAHIFCLTCAQGVLESCPQCHAAAPTMTEEALSTEALSAALPEESKSDLRVMIGLALVILVVLLVLAVTRR